MINFFISIFLISASIISYEILLMRLFSIAQWHHFAYMIISLALLGFGASGTAIAILQRWILRYFKQAFIACGLIYAYATVGCFLLSQLVPFNPFMIIWDKRQYFYLLTNYIILFVPFFFGASCIGLGLMKFKEHINRLYFADLVGAGTGALAIVLAMYFIPPENNLLLVSGLGFLSAFIASIPPFRIPNSEFRIPFLPAGIIAFLALSFIGYFGLSKSIKLNISQYKGLSATLNFPDAKILDKKFSPLGLLHVVSSKSIRYAPLSLAYEGTLPQQLALFTDADSMSAITEVKDISQMDYLDYTTSALPYHLKKQPKVLILGAGGGADVLAALYHNANSVDAVELNPQVVELVREKYGDFTGNIYPSPPFRKGGCPFTKGGTIDGKAISKKWPVRVVVAEARGFVQSTKERYDLIQVALLDSFSASASGVYALSESYLYTVEAIQEFLRHLNEGGILAITRWLKLPPRDTLKLFATIVEALEHGEREKDGRVDTTDLMDARGRVIDNSRPRASIRPALERSEGSVVSPWKQLIFIRSWKTGTILVKNGAFTEEEIAAMKDFCEKRSFDLVYYPGIVETEANRYNLLEQPEYFRGVQTILFGDRQKFFRDYAFNIKPATDNKPYFFHFFKWKSVPLFLETMRKGWIPFVEWGYIILIATLIQAICASLILILVPLSVTKSSPLSTKSPPLLKEIPPAPLFQRGEKGGILKLRICVYFLSLGLGFMFIEMAFIQKFILLLSYPTYAIAVVLCSFLVFAGFGSLFSKRLRLEPVKPVIIAVLSIIFISLLYLLFLDDLFRLFISQTDAVKIPIAIMLIAPLAFFMGMPFPLGLQQVSDTAPNLIPWAWGINGCASVISAVLATCLAISFGFAMVVIIAAVLYGIAAAAYR